MSKKESNVKVILILWGALIVGALYLYFFQNDFIQSKAAQLASVSLVTSGTIYLVASCLRGFTLVPVTYFIVLGLLFLPPVPLFIFTMIGVMVSSTCLYYFSGVLNLDRFFKKQYSKQIKTIKKFLDRYEFPVVLAWSFLPITPTDLICYVCGELEVDIKKFLLAVFIGEAAACAIYIFLGEQILSFLHIL
ncbi:VTT domain-containing protein [Candidatus Parcubacteria bacterium]|nr:VTT domain-containing protein [Candidatus Parcubacteria bacterium]